MAVDPTTFKVVVGQAMNILTDEEKRSDFIIFLVILIVIIFSIIILPIYLLTSPLEIIGTYLSQEEQGIIEGMHSSFKNNFGMGNITINSKLGFPLENIDRVIITAEYGYYDPFNTGKATMHTGIDLSGVHRDNVLAVEKGIITFAGVQNGYGNCVEIKHIVDGQQLYTFYAHLSSIGVNKGQEVEQGFIIGKEGGDPYTDNNAGNSTGHHLHFEVRTASGYGNAVNPKNYIF